jgi:cobalamin biosynthesis protein CbiD
MGARPYGLKMLGLAATAGLAAFAAACIPVEVRVPEPIEINLNVNIRQEVVVRLEGDAQQLLQERPDIF